MLKVYYMNVSGGCTYVQGSLLDAIIAPERLEKIQRQKNAANANKQRVISAFMQYVLAKELNCPIEQVAFEYGPYGKPKLSNSELCFNLSHSGDYVVMAICDRNIGIDIEGKKRDRLHIAKRFFCSQEYESIMERQGQVEQENRFLELWTMKEAAVKYLGTGLQTAFDSFLLEEENENGVSCTHFSDEEMVWFSTQFLGNTGYCISVCGKEKDEICRMKEKNWIEIRLEQIESDVSSGRKMDC